MNVILTMPNQGLFEASLLLFTLFCGCMCLYHYVRYRIERKRQAARWKEYERTHVFGPSGFDEKVRD